MNSSQPDPRFKKRLPCDLSFAGHRYPGIILNISRTGLFVQTSMRARPGETVDLELSAPDARHPIALQARVVWKRIVAPQLRSVHQAGLGLQIHDPSMSYDGLVGGIESSRGQGTASGPSKRPTKDAGPEDGEEYRVRLGLEGSQRTRTLTLRAASEQDAKEQAASHCGPQWTVLGLEKQ